MEGYGYGYEVFCTLWVFPLLFLSYDFNHLHHETIMRTRIALKKIINKSLLNLALLWNRVRLAISKKNRNIFRYQTTNFLKYCTKENKGIKRQLYINFLKLWLRLLSFKFLSQITGKIFATQRRLETLINFMLLLPHFSPNEFSQEHSFVKIQIY